MDKQLEPTRRTLNEMRDAAWLQACYPGLDCAQAARQYDADSRGMACADKPNGRPPEDSYDDDAGYDDH